MSLTKSPGLCYNARMERLTYTLMNREAPLCDFIIEGEGELELCKITKERGKLPFWCADIDSWTANRSAAKHRERGGQEHRP